MFKTENLYAYNPNLQSPIAPKLFTFIENMYNYLVTSRTFLSNLQKTMWPDKGSTQSRNRIAYISDSSKHVLHSFYN